MRVTKAALGDAGSSPLARGLLSVAVVVIGVSPDHPRSRGVYITI